MVRKRKAFYRSFADAKYTSAEAALEAAIACRDSILKELKSGKDIAETFATYSAPPRQKKQPDKIIRKRDKSKSCIYRLKTRDGWFIKFRRAGKEFFRSFPDRSYKTADDAYQDAVKVRDSMLDEIKSGTSVATVYDKYSSIARKRLNMTLTDGSREKHLYRHYAGINVKSNSWVVRLRYKKETICQYFNDSEYGNTKASYQAAKEFLSFVHEAIDKTGELPTIPQTKKKSERGIRREENRDGESRWHISVRRGNARIVLSFCDKDYDGSIGAYEAALEMKHLLETNFESAINVFLNKHWRTL